MVDRMSVWIGAGVVTAAVSAALLGGAGVAVAAPEPGAGQQTTVSSGSPDTTGPEAAGSGTDTTVESEPADVDGSGQDEQADTSETADDELQADLDEDLADEADAELTDDDSVPVDAPGSPDGIEPDGIEPAEADGVQPDSIEPDEADAIQSDGVEADRAGETPSTAMDSPAAEVGSAPGDPADVADEAVEAQLADEADAVAEPADDVAEVVQPAGPVRRAAFVAVEADRAPPAPVVTEMAMVAADGPVSSQAATAPRQTLLSIIGAVVFNLIGFATRVVTGPPQLPPGSTVTVHSSTLTIDCGEGYEVPVDWYVPEGPTPTRLVYTQHGFMASGPMYSYTAARLAESTHSIVVVPSLTSNFLACDGCWVGGTQMHSAVADLFVDGNTALADSATAAGYSSTLLDDVDRVVLIGHSAGGGLVAGTAGYMATNGSIDRLAGVVMLDGVGFGSVVPDALAKLPDDVPFYDLAARSYFWNMNGTGAAELAQARPDQFIGARLLDSSHGDFMVGGNPLIQASMNLITGWPKAGNVKAAELITAAWINDMFAGTQTAGYYGEAGELLEFDTSRGPASAYVLPGPPERLSLVDMVFQFVSGLLFGINFATCAAEPEEETATLSGPDTLLSLDDGTKPGQSIGQHVCTG